MEEVAPSKQYPCLELSGFSGFVNIYLDGTNSPFAYSFTHQVRVEIQPDYIESVQPPSDAKPVGVRMGFEEFSEEEEYEYKPDLATLEENDFHTKVTKEEALDEEDEIDNNLNVKVFDDNMGEEDNNSNSTVRCEGGESLMDTGGADGEEKIETYGNNPDTSSHRSQEKVVRRESRYSRLKLWPADPYPFNLAKGQKRRKILQVLQGLSPEETSSEKDADMVNWMCLYCNESFPSDSHLMAHLRSLESLRHCEKCGEAFLCETDLFLHLHSHHDHDYVVATYPSFNIREKSKCVQDQCSLCEANLSSARSLYRHLLTNHFLDDKTFVCCVCGMKMRTYDNMVYHMKKHPIDQVSAPHDGVNIESHNQSKTNNIKAATKPVSKAKSGKYGASVSPKVSKTSQIEHCEFPVDLKLKNLPSSSSNNNEPACNVKVRKKPQKKLEHKVCQYCCKVFPSANAKMEHMSCSVPHQTCTKCKATFSSEAELIYHDHRDHTSSELKETVDVAGSDGAKVKAVKKCPVGKCMYKGTLPIVDHISEMHTKELRFRCCICDKKFTSRRLLFLHHGTHRNPQKVKESVYRCSLCSAVFTSNSDFVVHSKTHFNTCRICGKDFGHRLLLESHQKKEHPGQLLTCEQCGKQMACPVQFAQHMKNHRFVKSTQCPVCGKMIKMMKQHMIYNHPEYYQRRATETRPQSETGDEGTKLQDSSSSLTKDTLDVTNATTSASSPPSKLVFQCPKCPKTFPREYGLKRHVHEQHGTLVKCPLCSKSLKNNHILQRHLKSVHIKDEMFMCEICGKQCNRKSNLAIHMRTHALFKVFPCKLCDQGFNYKASLQSHMMSKHHCELVDG